MTAATTTTKKRKLEFPVPEDLKKSAVHIKRIAIEGDSFIIEHKSQKISEDDKGQSRIKFQITGYTEEDMETLRGWARANFFFVEDEKNRDSLIDQLVICVHNIYATNKEAFRAIAEIKAKNDAAYEAVEEQEEVKLKKQYLHKYFDKSQNVLYEAVLIGNKACFVNIDWDFKTGELFAQLSEKLLLPDAQHPTMELLPPEREMYLSKPYEFANEHEINKYLTLTTEETLDTLYRKQKILASKYIDANDTHLTMLAADAIASYFQDKLGQVHYDMFVGDNDTGKTANLVYFQYEAYRAMLDVDITPANIYGFLGNFEEGQGIILEDEADDIDKQPEKMKIYKAGYNAGKKVTRTDITSFGGRKTVGWNTYCFKVFTAEDAPNTNKAKGFLDRTFVFHCTSGTPLYDIQEIINPAGDNEFVELLKELDHNRKLLFAYRLLHYSDPLPNIDLSVRNREKQLCKPVLRLFQDSECQEEIGIALADMIGQKRGIKRDTLEAKILALITRIIENREKEEAQRRIDGKEREWVFSHMDPNQIPTAELFESVRLDLNGEYKRQGDKSFDTEEHGVVSHDKIRRVCVDKFGGEPKRSNSVRYLEFNREKLEKAKAAYIFPDKVVILQKNVSESDSDHGDRNDEVSEGIDVNESVSTDETNQEDPNNSINEPQSIKEVEEVGGNGHAKEDKDKPIHPQTLSFSSLPSQQNSDLTLQKPVEETLTDIINKCMLDEQGNNQGYFDMNRWKTRLMCLPRQHPLHCNEDQAEQTLYALIQEGKVREQEMGRYKPTTT